jgi:hypothetical protein
MASDDAVLVEDFLEAIASQLDRAQDGLAFKAVNRPLTYAIKDFNLQLQVFVEVDVEGNIRLRSSGPNESGASTMTIAFTTITRPMIQENTISLAATKGPTLDEAGFTPAERQRLERLGVRNTAQLRRLGSSTGASVVSRLSRVPVDRLRAALQVDHPAVTSVKPVLRATQPSIGGDPDGDASSPVVRGPRPSLRTPPADGPAPAPSLVEKTRRAPSLVRIGPDASHLQVAGTSLATDDAMPEVRLDGVPLAMSESDWDQIVVAIPLEVESGLLEVELPGGGISHYRIVRDRPSTAAAGDEFDGSWPDDGDGGAADGHDPWMSNGQ